MNNLKSCITYLFLFIFHNFYDLFNVIASPAGPFPRPNLLPGRETSMGLHHPSDLLARPYADQLAHQVNNFFIYYLS